MGSPVEACVSSGCLEWSMFKVVWAGISVSIRNIVQSCGTARTYRAFKIQ